MSPTCSSRFLVGRKTRSAVARTIGPVCYHSTGTFATQCVLYIDAAGMPGELDLSVDRGTGIPLGAQLAGRIRTAVQNGTLVSGERVPSVRELADIAGVNVNTARAVYARLESEGLVRSEQGRGTFIAERVSAGGAATRQELHRQIAELEAALVRLPPPPLGSDDSTAVSPARARRAALDRGSRGRARPPGRPPPRARRAARRGSPAARRTRSRGRGGRGAPRRCRPAAPPPASPARVSAGLGPSEVRGAVLAQLHDERSSLADVVTGRARRRYRAGQCGAVDRDPVRRAVARR